LCYNALQGCDISCRCLIVYQQRRQYIPCFSDEVKLNYPKKSSLNAEQQSLFLQLMIKYAKKCPFPTPVDEKELQQYEVCVFHIYIYIYVYVHIGLHGAGLHKSWVPGHMGSQIFYCDT
jgi:hypothetical protein